MDIKELDEVYDSCLAKGHIYYLVEADFERVKTMLWIVELDIAANESVSHAVEKMRNYSLLWKSRYDVIRQLVDAILLLEKVKSNNHQCLYAFMCTKHPEWDIDWKTIETMRLLRNGAYYEGRPVTQESWKEFKLKFDIYIKTFLAILKEKLKEEKVE